MGEAHISHVSNEKCIEPCSRKTERNYLVVGERITLRRILECGLGSPILDRNQWRAVASQVNLTSVRVFF
jgi:hypothetical protein